INQYNINATGPVTLTGAATGNLLDANRKQALQDLLNMGHPNLFEDSFKMITNRTIANADTIKTAIIPTTEPANGGTWTWTTPFPTTGGTTGLGAQLKMIARLIHARAALGHNRQIFFASVGGYDTHDNQLTLQGNLFTELSNGMKAFYDALGQLGTNEGVALQDMVTTFTTSDFSRTFGINGTGSDHGWGNHQLVMGGKVLGGQLYGHMPSWVIGSTDDSGTGRWIPSTAVDEYSATLARWFGVTDTNMPTVFPNIGRFANPNVGFMNLT